MIIFSIFTIPEAAIFNIHHHVDRFSYHIEPVLDENAFSEGFSSCIYFFCNW